MIIPALITGACLVAVRCFNGYNTRKRRRAHVASAEAVDPTPEQLDTLRHMFRENDIVFLGDTDHSRLEVMAWAMHPKVQKLMHDECVGMYGIEQSSRLTDTMRDFEAGGDEMRMAEALSWNLAGNLHIDFEGAQVFMMSRHIAFAQNSHLLGTPVLRGIDPRRGVDQNPKAVHMLPLSIGMAIGQAYKTLVDPNVQPWMVGFYAAMMFTPKAMGSTMQRMVDDAPLAASLLEQHAMQPRKEHIAAARVFAKMTHDSGVPFSAKNLVTMMQHAAPMPDVESLPGTRRSAVFFGWGHVKGEGEREKSLTHHLTKAGFKVAVVPIFADAKAVVPLEPGLRPAVPPQHVFVARVEPGSSGVIGL